MNLTEKDLKPCCGKVPDVVWKPEITQIMCTDCRGIVSLRNTGDNEETIHWLVYYWNDEN